jgi:hypothetical protein
MKHPQKRIFQLMMLSLKWLKWLLKETVAAKYLTYQIQLEVQEVL